MRVVKDDEREYCVGDNNCLKCVVLKRDNIKVLIFVYLWNWEVKIFVDY